MPKRDVCRKHRCAIELNSVHTTKDHDYIGFSEAESQTVGNFKIETALYFT